MMGDRGAPQPDLAGFWLILPAASPASKPRPLLVPLQFSLASAQAGLLKGFGQCCACCFGSAQKSFLFALAAARSSATLQL